MKQNIWQNDFIGAVIQCEECPEGDGWYPLISASRVRGSTYTPYTRGSSEWVRRANLLLADIAKANFETRC